MWLKRIQRQVTVTRRDRGRDETGHGGWRRNIHTYHWLQMDESMFSNIWCIRWRKWICPEKYSVLWNEPNNDFKNQWRPSNSLSNISHCIFPWAPIKRVTSQEAGKDNSAGAVGAGSSGTYALCSVVKVRRRPPSWPVTQILKQGPAVALASVSSNLPVPQRRSALTG